MFGTLLEHVLWFYVHTWMKPGSLQWVNKGGLLTEGPSNIPVLPCATASFPVVLGDFGCDITCQACREVRLGRLANNGKSKMAAPSQECDFSQNSWRNEKKASEIGWDSLINVCHQIHRDVGEISFKESFRVYTCYYRRSVISSFDCIKKYGFNSAQQIVASQECVHVPLNVPGEGSCLSGMS